MDSPVFLPARKKRECCSFMLDSSGNGKKKKKLPSTAGFMYFHAS
jgi:hypothetical protein